MQLSAAPPDHRRYYNGERTELLTIIIIIYQLRDQDKIQRIGPTR